MDRVLMAMLLWLGRSLTASPLGEYDNRQRGTGEYEASYTPTIPSYQPNTHGAREWYPSLSALNIFSRQSRQMPEGDNNEEQEESVFGISSEGSDPFVRSYRFRGAEDDLATLVGQIREAMRRVSSLGESRGDGRIGESQSLGTEQAHQSPLVTGRKVVVDRHSGNDDARVTNRPPQKDNGGYHVSASNGKGEHGADTDRQREISGDRLTAGAQGLHVNHQTAQPHQVATVGDKAVFGTTPVASKNPPHLIVPADTVNEIYRQIIDENPNNWIEHKYPPDVFPKKVEIPLTLVRSNYIGTMTIGTAKPGKSTQKVKVLFDTGSRVLWVLTKEACVKKACQENNPFDKEASSSYETDGQQMLTTFVSTAQVSGVKAKEDITIGEGDNKLVIKGQEFGQVTDFNEMFQYYEVLMGLDLVAPPFMHGMTVSPLYQMTKQFGTAPVFGFYINRRDKTKCKIVFGGGDEDLIVGSFTNHPVHKIVVHGIGRWYNGWNIKVDRLIVKGQDSNSKTEQIPIGDEFFAHPDTGATLISGPEKIIKNLNTEIFKFSTFKYNNDFSFECEGNIKEMKRSFPKVFIVIDGHEYVLQPSDYIGKLKGKCTTFFRGHTTYSYLLLGRIFMQKYYTRFDHGQKLVQFGLAK